MTRVLFDFSDPLAAAQWQAIDDRVMGGLSHSRLRHDPTGHAVFEGQVSLARHGGFASVRSSPGDRGLPGAEWCAVEVCGDARPFKLALLTDDGFDRPGHQASFTPAGGEAWQTLRLSLSAFRASFRGRELAGAAPLDPAHIRQVGLMIATREAGPFVLRLRHISLHRGTGLVQ